ncbi:uroporphyrinogen-III C-methyltransferase [Chryseobacterium daecheongense]|uniref:uroporphyrinogen-III C-methyltransferase n=1 Tax=Chryseobacterium daecheongense TaxID=192389 RepID=UPI001FD6EB83|nr:uroporphyrinogen-III C-methyltransferase [Chryseobacterium daecheongense]UOU97502.1 uroporphyrinogen-III C-methyltransferase [Chryseobacterium daecheongense]
MNATIKTPKVYLIGAGPGDPDLITVKAVKALAEAEIILSDRLVSPEILQQYANKNAEIIYVGKECSKNASTPQALINELIVDYALQNKNVVRLKGGDVSIFSNILDELQTLKQNKISYEIIPGITAALGAAAYAGMPLTARNHATSVRFLTYYKSEILDENYWNELAVTNDTLVFYMSKGNLSSLVEKLIDLNISRDKKIAIIEQATTPYQKVYTSSFDDFKANFPDKHFISPSLVVIGKVVRLHEEFSWLENAKEEDLYFKSVVNGSLIPTTQNLFQYVV